MKKFPAESLITQSHDNTRNHQPAASLCDFHFTPLPEREDQAIQIGQQQKHWLKWVTNQNKNELLISTKVKTANKPTNSKKMAAKNCTTNPTTKLFLVRDSTKSPNDESSSDSLKHSGKHTSYNYNSVENSSFPESDESLKSENPPKIAHNTECLSTLRGTRKLKKKKRDKKSANYWSQVITTRSSASSDEWSVKSEQETNTSGHSITHHQVDNGVNKSVPKKGKFLLGRLGKSWSSMFLTQESSVLPLKNNEHESPIEKKAPSWKSRLNILRTRTRKVSQQGDEGFFGLRRKGIGQNPVFHNFLCFDEHLSRQTQALVSLPLSGFQDLTLDLVSGEIRDTRDGKMVGQAQIRRETDSLKNKMMMRNRDEELYNGGSKRPPIPIQLLDLEMNNNNQGNLKVGKS